MHILPGSFYQSELGNYIMIGCYEAVRAILSRSDLMEQDELPSRLPRVPVKPWSSGFRVFPGLTYTQSSAGLG